MIQSKLHDYLGMTLYYPIFGQVSIMILSYIEDILTAFEKEYLKGKVAKLSAAPNNLFVVKEDCKNLEQEKKHGFSLSSEKEFVCYKEGNT